MAHRRRPESTQVFLLLELWAHVLWPLRRDGFPVELYLRRPALTKNDRQYFALTVNLQIGLDGIYSEDSFTLDNRKSRLTSYGYLHSGHGFLGLHMGKDGTSRFWKRWQPGSPR